MRSQKTIALLLAFLIPVGLIGQAASSVKALSAGPASAPASYFVSTNGSDSNPGSQAQPWRTVQKAVTTIATGDTVYVRGGRYDGIPNGWIFENSGTQANPITLTNYPGEQVVFKHTTSIDSDIFKCLINPHDPPSWQTPKADYIRIIGTDVTPGVLSNGVTSRKGIVIQGLQGIQAHDIYVSGCDYWEVAGVDFVETAGAIRTQKNSWGGTKEYSSDHWYVHDNRVYIFYAEAGMQFNGDDNRIENNEIYKVTNRDDTPYGCTLLNILGDHNIIKGNTLSRLGSTARCGGLLFEWDLSDANTVEQNRIFDVMRGIEMGGGDNNVIRNNLIYAPSLADPVSVGIGIVSYDNSIMTAWPCNETSEAPAVIPANNPIHPDYQNYYNPRNCHSYGTQIYNNTIHGFVDGILFAPLFGEGTIIRNNVFSGWTHASIALCGSGCKPLPAALIADHNASQGDFGFANLGSHNFHLTAASSLIDAGYDLGALNQKDFDGNARPRGEGYDIGAFERVPLFGDVPVPGKEWMKSWIDAFYNAGITAGCGGGNFCPENNVTRAEMAVFLLRATHGGGYVPPSSSRFFSDVPLAGKEWMEPWIDQYYREGMTTGCGSGNYCPESSVARADMAVFVLRALHGGGYVPPAASGVFGDVPVAGKEWMEPWIIQFRNEGITSGCGGGNFCPESEVTRAEMAVFLGRAFHF